MAIEFKCYIDLRVESVALLRPVRVEERAAVGDGYAIANADVIRAVVQLLMGRTRIGQPASLVRYATLPRWVERVVRRFTAPSSATSIDAHFFSRPFI